MLTAPTLVSWADLGVKNDYFSPRVHQGGKHNHAPRRFSIRSLLAVIAISGVGLAMLRSPLPIGECQLPGDRCGPRCGASNTILRRDSRRAYRVGFTLFVTAFIMMSDQLVTQPMLDLLYP